MSGLSIYLDVVNKMGIELTKGDLIPQAQAMIKSVGSVQEVAKAVEDNGANLKDLADFARIVENIIVRVQSMQDKKMGQQSTINGSPMAPSESVQIVERAIDEKKVIAGFRDLLINTAPKLPDDIQEMKIKDFIGENFSKVKIKIMGLDANGDQLVEIIATQLIDQIKRCYK